MGLWNILSWLYISWVCDVLFRWFLRTFKSIADKKDNTDSDADLEKEISTKIRERTRNQEKTVSKGCHHHGHKGCRGGLRGLSGQLKSIFSKRSVDDTLESHIPEDPLVKDGLRREDKFINGGNVKVSSYYDKDGKMVFQRETILPPPSVNDIKDKSTDVNNPSFYIKPQSSSDKPMQDFQKIEEHIDKTFGSIYGVRRDLAEADKSLIDEHIDKTFKDIYDMVLPSIF